MLTPDDIAARVQATFRPMAKPLVYRTTALYSPKAAALTPVGTTTITLNTLPVGIDRVKVGDTFNSGLQTFTAEVLAVGGVITNAPFTPALTVQIAAGAAVQVTRNIDTPCRGWCEWLDTSKPLTSGLVKQTDQSVTILADSLPFTPKVGDRAGEAGRPKTINNIGRDPAGTGWVLQTTG